MEQLVSRFNHYLDNVNIVLDRVCQLNPEKPGGLTSVERIELDNCLSFIFEYGSFASMVTSTTDQLKDRGNVQDVMKLFHQFREDGTTFTLDESK